MLIIRLPKKNLLINFLHKFQIPFQLGLSKMDLRKTLKSSLSGVSWVIFQISWSHMFMAKQYLGFPDTARQVH